MRADAHLINEGCRCFFCITLPPLKTFPTFPWHFLFIFFSVFVFACVNESAAPSRAELFAFCLPSSKECRDDAWQCVGRGSSSFFRS